MDTKKIITNNVNINNTIKNLISPLSSYINIENFYYYNIHNDGMGSLIGNSIPFLESYIAHGLHLNDSNLVDITCIDNGTAIWSSHKNKDFYNKFALKMNKIFEFGNSISFIIKDSKQYSSFTFNSRYSENDAMLMFYNNVKYLYEFNNYFSNEIDKNKELLLGERVDFKKIKNTNFFSEGITKSIFKEDKKVDFFNLIDSFKTNMEVVV